MTNLPSPPYQHYLARITQDENKPEILWLHFHGSETPYRVPVDARTIATTHDFLTHWLERHQPDQGPGLQPEPEAPRADPEQPVTFTVPYWVATRIRSAMHRLVTEPEGCRCEEHSRYTIDQPLEAYKITRKAMTSALREGHEEHSRDIL